VPADALPRDALTASQLDRHLGVSGSLQPRFWASPAMWPWQRGQLVALRKGRPACCASGPVRLLDLPGMRHAAAVGAGIRHQLWQQVVHGSRPATPWPIFLARHLADPRRYPYPTAHAAFHHQPRVNAMRMHNAACPGGHLPVAELEMFQAGPAAYQHYSACTAICGDALLTADGHQLAPDSDALTHRVTYLEQAVRHLDRRRPDRLLPGTHAGSALTLPRQSDVRPGRGVSPLHRSKEPHSPHAALRLRSSRSSTSPTPGKAGWHWRRPSLTGGQVRPSRPGAPGWAA
jgi:hypothetical protein